MDKNPGLVFQSGAWEKETNTYGSIWTSQDNYAPVKPNFCYKEKQVEVSFPNGKTVTATTWNTDVCHLQKDMKFLENVILMYSTTLRVKNYAV